MPALPVLCSSDSHWGCIAGSPESAAFSAADLKTSRPPWLGEPIINHSINLSFSLSDDINSVPLENLDTSSSSISPI